MGKKQDDDVCWWSSLKRFLSKYFYVTAFCVALLCLPVSLGFAPLHAETVVITDGYETKPDDDPFHYFPTRPFLREGMEDMANELNRYVNVSPSVLDTLLGEIVAEVGKAELFFSFNATAEALYDAAIQVGDCRLAERLVWDQLTDVRPFLAGFRHDSSFDRNMRRRLFEDHFPALATCLYAHDARTLSVLVSRHSEAVTGTRALVRPFLHHQSWFSGRNTLHGRRDYNFWQLIEMATSPGHPNYGPAGVMLVELALELDSLDLPNDILHMLLLRAGETWPAGDRPLPVTRERIDDLLPITAAQLSEEELANAELCALTDEPYRRLFLGESAYAEVSEDERCVVALP